MINRGFRRLFQRTFSTSLEKKYPAANAAIEEFSKKKQTPVTVNQFLALAKNRDDPRMAQVSVKFVFVTELPIRIAHITKYIDELPESLRIMPTVQLCKEWYLQTMTDLVEFQKQFQKYPDKPDLIEESCELARKILRRHAGVVTTMAKGVFDARTELSAAGNKNVEAEILSYEKFLNRLFLSRIGTRLIMSQHVEIFSPESRGKEKKNVGVFEEKLDMKSLVEEAAAASRFLVQKQFISAPNVKLEIYDRSKKGKHDRLKKDENIYFPYVPSHLYHIIFELLKNSMRAICEFHAESEEFPDIRIVMVKGNEDLTLKISDRGGGVPLSINDRLFSYTYSTAQQPPLPDSPDRVADMNNAPLAGFGYGLPLSRLYARYFGGDLKLYSTEGYGMDALVYLKATAVNAREVLTELDGLYLYEKMDDIDLRKALEKKEKEIEMLHTTVEKTKTLIRSKIDQVKILLDSV